MKKILFILTFLVIFVHANESHSKQIKIYFDTNNTMKQDSMYALKEQMQDVTNDNLSYGFKEESIWLYVKVKNNTELRQSRFIVFLHPLIGHMKIWGYTNHKQFEYFHMGYLEAFNNRKVDDAKLIIPYTLVPYEEKEFIIKVNSPNSMRLNMKFDSRENYYKLEKKSGDAISFYFGAVMIILIYNLFLYSMIRERVYLDYVLFHFVFMFMQVTISGIGFSIFWQKIPQINEYILPILVSLSSILLIRFISSFIEIKKFSLKISKYLNYIIIAYLILILLTFILPHIIIAKILSVVLFSSTFIYYLIVLYMYIRFRTKNAIVFLIAWPIFFIGVIITILVPLGIVAESFFTINASRIGSLIELSLLSFALAYRYNKILVDLKVSQVKIKDLNTNLEEKINSQTKHLKLAIYELHHRVKNNFQFISTFLWAQKRATKSPEVVKSIEQIKDRVYAISSLHEMLNSYNTISISTKEYFKRIIEGYKYDKNSVDIEVRLDDNSDITYDDLVALGLILNELLTNSYKYAFKGILNPKIEVNFIHDNNEFSLIYKDNGVGCDSEKLNTQSGLGFDLIHGFSQKLKDSKMKIETDHGFYLALRFNDGL